MYGLTESSNYFLVYKEIEQTLLYKPKAYFISYIFYSESLNYDQI